MMTCNLHVEAGDLKLYAERLPPPSDGAVILHIESRNGNNITLFLHGVEDAEKIITVAKQARDILDLIAAERTAAAMTPREREAEGREIRAQEKLDAMMGK